MGYGQYSERTAPYNGIAGRKSKTNRKTVYDTDQIAHLWAHQTQDFARNSRNNFYFRDDTIYSYGSHFPIARVFDSKGRKVVFLTTRTYSNTTSGHIWEVRRAIPASYTVFNCVDPRRKPGDLLAEYKSEIERLLADVGNAKNKISRAKRYSVLVAAINNANNFCEFFGYKTRFDVPNEAEAKTLADEHQRRKEASERRQAIKLAKEIEAKRKAFQDELPQLIQNWRETGSIGKHLSHDEREQFPTICRIDGDEIVTSKGARFPVEHARKALPTVKTLIDAGRTFQRNGQQIRLGHYQIDQIDESGTVHAGCHLVPREEVLRLIEALS